MSDRKYYNLSSNSELNYEMSTYLASARVRPPMALLKKLLINLTLNRQHFHTDKIVSFVCEILRQWKDVAGVCEIGYRVLDMYGVWTVDAVDCVLEMPDNDQRWSVLANVDVKSTDRQVLKYVSDAIYNHILDVSLNAPEKVRLCVRGLEKLSFLGEREKIDRIMDMLYAVIGDPVLTESACDVLIDLNDRMKNVDIPVVVNRTYVEKIVSNVKGAPSVFTLLTKYKIALEDSELKGRVVNWALPYVHSGVFPIVMNAIKCVLYYTDKRTTNLLPDILIGLDKMIEEGKMTVGYKRTLLFDVLRNMILLVVEYGSNGFGEFTKKYIRINEDVDVEPYIVDTKLELMYLLSLHGGDEERKLINDWLVQLSGSGNDEHSYKAIRTVGNLYMRQEGICDSLMATLVGTLTYVNKVKERREELHYTIGEGMWKDDDIIGYIGTLAVIGDVDELVSLQEPLWKRVAGKDSRVIIMDAYVNALVRGYISSGGDKKEDVVAVLNRARDEMGPVISKRVNTLLSLRDVAILDSNANSANRREPPETPLAVSVDSLGTLASGGAFDINYTIRAPNGATVVQEEKQRQGDYLFSADQIGEYEFCFDNEMSTFAEKVIDFEIKTEDDLEAKKIKANLPVAPNKNDAVDNMHALVETIENKLTSLENSLNYYKTRNNRNQSTVKSTKSRVFWFSLFDLALMLAMAAFQVLVVKFFFQGSRKQLV
ncbi:hypothetical protein CANINC_004980 [Pichia inconspicua]|uniref:GOLD domain-containing protein n=1 Tax=Pichia inconspicua TaxID=52247 RepID=A0A4T0WUP9_9ASCO|nr:hypothetical protein CANINC_004980 [[Candida] inconspicua]